MSNRLARINEQLKREVAQILRREVRDPRVGVVTVTAVETVKDLAVAKVFVRVMGSDEEKAETLEGLETAAPYVRRLLAESLTLRHVPELRFQIDRSLEHAQRIESILSEVLPEDEEPEAPDEDEVAGAPHGPASPADAGPDDDAVAADPGESESGPGRE